MNTSHHGHWEIRLLEACRAPQTTLQAQGASLLILQLLNISVINTAQELCSPRTKEGPRPWQQPAVGSLDVGAVSMLMQHI